MFSCTMVCFCQFVSLTHEKRERVPPEGGKQRWPTLDSRVSSFRGAKSLLQDGPISNMQGWYLFSLGQSIVTSHFVLENSRLRHCATSKGKMNFEIHSKGGEVLRGSAIIMEEIATSLSSRMIQILTMEF